MAASVMYLSPLLLLMLLVAAVPHECGSSASIASALARSEDDSEVCLLQAHRTRSWSAVSTGQDRRAFGLEHHDVWLGMDPERGSTQLALLTTEEAHVRKVQSEGADDDDDDGRGQGLPVQIMGHYNTGTHLLHELLIENFGDKIALPLNDDASSRSGCRFWKHSLLSVLKTRGPQILEGCDEKIGLAIVRNPLSWLRSFKRVAFDLWYCKDGEDWLTRACRYPPSIPGLLSHQQFANVEDIWSTWTHDYEALPSFGFNKSLLIRYEDLVLDTDGVLEKIASLADLRLLKKDIKQVDDSMNPTAEKKKNAHKMAVDKINQRSYIDEFSSEELSQICSRVDREAMRRHGYGDCDDLKL